jgi:hypothetical protein
VTAETMKVKLSEIELAQQGLRDSIQRARNLTEETVRLVLKHRTGAPKPLTRRADPPGPCAWPKSAPPPDRVSCV